MNEIKYEMIIYWSKQDSSYIVEVPERRVVWLMERAIRQL